MNDHLYRQLKAKYDRRNNNDEAMRVYYAALMEHKVSVETLEKEIERRQHAQAR